MNVNNEHFCQHPWVGLDITPQGEFRPCCKYSNMLADNLNDYLSSDELSDLKNKFLAGEKPAGCSRCWSDESAGLPSKRQLDQQYLFKDVPIDLTSFKVLSLAFGNSCNLACATCNSYSSSAWIREEKKAPGKFPTIKIHEHRRFYQDSEFINGIKQISTNLIHVEFPGGEPFLAGIDEHLDFLDYLLDKNSANISLHYMTNATIFPSIEFWSRWRNFKEVDIQLSIDGTREQYEYIRWPAKWNAVNDVINAYVNKQQTVPNLKLSISHTVSIFNVYYLPEFFKWCLKNKLGKPYIGLVNDPVAYNIRSLPSVIKEKISEKISRFKFENVVSYMYEMDSSDEFKWEYIELLDHQRSQTFEVTFPEFYQLLKETTCQI